jgi:DNA-binding transcriptional regulator LsrR (DeoR family)
MNKAKSVKTLYDKKEKTVEEIARGLGISMATCYRYVDILKAEGRVQLLSHSNAVSEVAN